MKYLDFVFTGFPGPDGCQFIEVENDKQHSIGVGTWLKRDDGQVVLRIRTDNGDVLAFQEKFNIPMSPIPAFLDIDAMQFRVDFMKEELVEFVKAYHEQSVVDAADALIDLAYVVHGTALMMGLPWDKLWAEVQRANMTKVRATDPSQSKRKSSLDIVKPPNWQRPDHAQHLDGVTPPGSYFDTKTQEIENG